MPDVDLEQIAASLKDLNRLSNKEREDLIRSVSLSTREKLLAMFGADGTAARCHFSCKSKNHGSIGGGGGTPNNPQRPPVSDPGRDIG